MKCIEAQQLVKPYLQKQLSDRELEQFLDHVENCPECYDELEIYFVIYEALEDSRETHGADKYNFQEKLKQDIKNSRRYLHLRRAYRLFRYAVVLLAEVLLVFAILTGVEMMGEEGSRGTTIYRFLYGGQAETETETETETGTEAPGGTETETGTEAPGRTETGTGTEAPGEAAAGTATGAEREEQT